MPHDFLAAFFLLSFAAAAQPHLPPGPGRDALMKVCSTCHSPENVTGMAKTRDDWAALVGEMADQGAQATDAEFSQIVDYLAANFPDKINVNKAPARLFETVLELSDKEASAVIEYRQQKGGFRSLDDLEKVPGLDAKKIEQQKDRIEF